MTRLYQAELATHSMNLEAGDLETVHRDCLTSSEVSTASG